MKKLHFEIHLQEGEAITVTLAVQTTVWLLDEENYSKYAAGHAFRHLGAFAKHSPVRFLPPHGGHWHLLVDQDDEHTNPVVSILTGKLSK